jgi:hypothetical protein
MVLKTSNYSVSQESVFRSVIPDLVLQTPIAGTA